MKRLLAALFVLVPAATACSQQDTILERLRRKEIEPVRIQASDLHVFDGDTIGVDPDVYGARFAGWGPDALSRDGWLRLRLSNIDAPESGWEGAEQAERALRDLVAGEILIYQEDNGSYSRPLIHIYVAGGAYLNEEMVLHGHALVGWYGEHPDAERLLAAQSKAAGEPNGVWSNVESKKPIDAADARLDRGELAGKLVRVEMEIVDRVTINGLTILNSSTDFKAGFSGVLDADLANTLGDRIVRGRRIIVTGWIQAYPKEKEARCYQIRIAGPEQIEEVNR